MDIAPRTMSPIIKQELEQGFSIEKQDNALLLHYKKIGKQIQNAYSPFMAKSVTKKFSLQVKTILLCQGSNEVIILPQ